MEKDFIDELKEIVDAAIDENKVKTLILMCCDSDGNAGLLTRGKILDQAVLFSHLRKAKCIEKIERAASFVELVYIDKTPDDREV